MLQEIAKRKKVSLSFEIQPGLLSVHADLARLKQIFINLIHNAIKFNQTGGTVVVQMSTSEDNCWFVCDVTDSGVGIPEENIPDLFTEFYQVDSSYARREEGSGLGLALSKRLVELHGGTISVSSQLGVGSAFTFKLPKLPESQSGIKPSMSLGTV